MPGKDGRAGMAALTLKEGYVAPGTPAGVSATAFDANAFAAFVAKSLPAYSVPVFLRFLPECVFLCYTLLFAIFGYGVFPWEFLCCCCRLRHKPACMAIKVRTTPNSFAPLPLPLQVQSTRHRHVQAPESPTAQ